MARRYDQRRGQIGYGRFKVCQVKFPLWKGRKVVEPQLEVVHGSWPEFERCSERLNTVNRCDNGAGTRRIVLA